MTSGGKGFWTTIGALPQEEVDQLVKTTIDHGINFIDTADVYSEGLSEMMTGKVRYLGISNHPAWMVKRQMDGRLPA